MNKILHLLVLVPFIISAQESTFKNELIGIENEWHSIILDESVLSHVKEDLSDLRIYSISPTSDTIEVPYYLKEQNTVIENSGVNFKVINKSTINNDNYITFKLIDKKEINEILLEFHRENFDWRIDLQGSNNQKEWFEILNNYRILSIKNKQTDYSFTSIKFPDSEYVFYRITLKNKEKVSLKSAILQKKYERELDLEEIENEFTITNDKKNKTTVIDLKLAERLPISEIEMIFSDEIDYPRAINFEYLVDSLKSDKIWNYSYRNITNSYVSNSIENKFLFNSVYTNGIRITINNLDYQALNIKNIKSSFFKYLVVARFLDIENEHYIDYGNSKLRSPNYETKYLKEKAPSEMDVLNLGKQISLVDGKEINSGIEIKLWLWVIIGLILVLLIYSVTRMLKKSE